MPTVYEVNNGFYSGTTQVIAAGEPVPLGYVTVTPPSVSVGQGAAWTGSSWSVVPLPSGWTPNQPAQGPTGVGSATASTGSVFYIGDLPSADGPAVDADSLVVLISADGTQRKMSRAVFVQTLLSNAEPLEAAPAAAEGTAATAARSDHQHPSPEAIAYHTDGSTPGAGPSDSIPIFGMMNDAKSYGYAYRWQTDGGMDFIRRVNNVDTVLIALEQASGPLHLGGPASANAATASGCVRVTPGTFDNRLTFSGANGGSSPSVSVTSVSGQAGLTLRSAGEGAVAFFAGSRGLARFIPVANAVNYLAFSSSITGVGVGIGPEGSDANIDTNITGKGTGGLRLGSPAGGIGFYGANPTGKPVVTGNKSTNLQAVVTSLLAALGASDLNLIDDQTT